MEREQQLNFAKDNDGLYHVDYYSNLLFSTVATGAHKAWLGDVIAIISRNLTELESKGRLNELSKWAWFARQFRAGLERTNPKLLEAMGVSLDQIPPFGKMISYARPSGSFLSSQSRSTPKTS